MYKWLAIALFLASCSKTEVGLDGRPCDVNGACVTGYVCHPGSQTCVPQDANCTSTGVEICDGKDNDCDGVIDQDGAAGCEPFYLDADDDGYGNPATYVCLCYPDNAPVGAVQIGGDCDDNPSACGDACHPGATEICDGFDNDCQSATTEAPANLAGCTTYLRDQDGDMFGLTGDGQCLCAPSSLYSATQGGDCDDSPDTCGAACRPGLVERCDGFDNDCDASTAEDVLDLPLCTAFYRDDDGDGFGQDVAMQCACRAPAGYVALGGDCDDDATKCGTDCFPRARIDLVDACTSDISDSTPNDFDAFDNDCDGVINNGAACLAGVVLQNLTLPNSYIVALAQAPNGTLFIATQQPGVVAYLPVDASDVSILALPKNKVPTALLVDSNNALWVGYQEAGCGDPPGGPGPFACNCGPSRIALASGTTTQFCTDAMSGDANGVTTLALGPSGRVYVGTGDDYARWDPGGDLMCDVEVSSAALTGIVPLLADDNPAVYAANADGLYVCTTNNDCNESCSQLVNSTPASAFPNATALTALRGNVAANDDDVVMVGTTTDVRRFELGLGRYRVLSTNSVQVTALAADDNGFTAGPDTFIGTVFVGRAGDGIRWMALPYVVDEAELTAKAHPVNDFKTNYGLPSNNITALLYDDGAQQLWVGTPLGLFVVQVL